MSPRVRDIKERINKWDYINIKSFCTAKEYIHKMQRDPTIWNICADDISADDTSDKVLIYKLYKELTQFHSRKTNKMIYLNMTNFVFNYIQNISKNQILIDPNQYYPENTNFNESHFNRST